MRCRACLIFALLTLAFVSSGLEATEIFGTLRGIVHDPQHRPIAGASVTLESLASHTRKAVTTSAEGEFRFDALPLGKYRLTVSHSGFDDGVEELTLDSGAAPILHIPLQIASSATTVEVRANSPEQSASSATTSTLVTRAEIAATPGATRTDSLAMITDNVPGAYITHDQLHIRGGHQVTWLVDGVPVPNTNIASNLGPQFDPKDIEDLEILRGGLSADAGDRTYGVFNIVPRTGFDRNSDAELIVTYGSNDQTDDQINFGGHTDRFAYYASLNGNRTNLGIETPVSQIIHDAANGYGGFTSLMYNRDPSDQFRVVASLRQDYFQIPNTPQQVASSVADSQRETDGFLNVSWIRTISQDILLTLSPFFHSNRANYLGGPDDYPTSTQDNHRSLYAGGQATLGITAGRNNAQAGLYAFSQNDSEAFGLVFNDGSNPNFSQTTSLSGNLEAAWIEDQFHLDSWLTLSAGLRQTHFSGGVAENATDPRVGATFRVPKLNWVFRASYGDYYQAPPLLTVSGPLLDFITQQNFSYIPLRGERDEEHEFGLAIPIRRWTLDADTFETRARNFLDHNPIGNSNLFFPITIDGALIQGWEVTLRSAALWRASRFHLAYSNQLAQGRGAISGGLTDFTPPPSGYFYLDHDQRNTLNLGLETQLPLRIHASGNLYYGSGFANGYPPPSHLPGYATLDLSVSRDFGERISVGWSALNLTNRHLLIDNSQTFGGTHFNDPRELIFQLRYRFHY